MYIVIGILAFLACLFVVEMAVYAFRIIRNPDAAKLRQRVKRMEASGAGYETLNILRKRTLSEVPWLNRILLGIPGIQAADRTLQQANIRYPLGFFIMLIVLLGAVGYLGGLAATHSQILSIILGGLLALIPVFSITLKKKQRMQKFQRQLPDALELVARALRAGHGFSSGMKLAADEFGDPLGTEFGNTLDEINFGVGVAEALKNLANRVDCPDLKFFVVSVVVQRETGGNLAEIIENIARLIRERFKLLGRIKVLAAEGKLSAIILIALPFFVVLVLAFIRPEHVATLVTDSLGKMLIGVSIIMMIMGILVMRRIIDIRV